MKNFRFFTRPFFCINDTEKRQTGNFVKQIIKDLLKI